MLLLGNKKIIENKPLFVLLIVILCDSIGIL